MPVPTWATTLSLYDTMHYENGAHLTQGVRRETQEGRDFIVQQGFPRSVPVPGPNLGAVETDGLPDFEPPIGQIRGVHRRIGSSIVAALFALAAGCLGQSGPTAPSFPEGKTRVLFLGNSLTYVNDLPAMVEAIARLAGDTSIATATVAFPDFALEDYWNSARPAGLWPGVGRSSS